MVTTSLTSLPVKLELLKTWTVEQGKVDLYYGENSFEAILLKNGKTIKINQKWISGLPNDSLNARSDLLKNYFSKTYAVLKPLESFGYKLYINSKLVGGMLHLKDVETMNAKNQLKPRIRNFKTIPFNPPSLTKKMEERGEKKFKILSIDGGGTRGIIPLKVARELESYIGPLHETFDLIGGTSTGGLIACGLTAPNKLYSVDRILQIYEKYSPRIFVENPQRQLHNGMAKCLGLSTYLTKKLVSVLIEHPIYSNSGINEVTQELLGESLMKDARTNLLIPALDITEKPKAHYFTNLNEEDGLLAMRDVAVATSSAPTYFPHKRINFHTYVDGGLGWNNPALQCYIHAAANKVNASQEYILSLGTGFADIEGLSSKDENHNLLYWARNIFPIVGSAQSNLDETLSQLLGDRYWRINPKLDKEIPLDSYDKNSIKTLIDIGDQLVEDSQDLIRDIAKQLRPDKF